MIDQAVIWSWIVTGLGGLCNMIERTAIGQVHIPEHHREAIIALLDRIGKAIAKPTPPVA